MSSKMSSLTVKQEVEVGTSFLAHQTISNSKDCCCFIGESLHILLMAHLVNISER